MKHYLYRRFRTIIELCIKHSVIVKYCGALLVVTLTYPALADSSEQPVTSGTATAAHWTPRVYSSTEITQSATFWQNQQQQYSWRAGLRMANWEKLLSTKVNTVSSSVSLADSHTVLKKVNRFFNSIPFRDDQSHWRREDYWATPIEFISSNGGDCEDYAIGKYFTLRAMGVADQNLQITYVNHQSRRAGQQAHMVLLYLGNNRNDPLVLDNLNSRIKPLSERTELKVIYGFNADNLWQKGQQESWTGTQQIGVQQRVGRPNRIRQWSNLLTRLANGVRAMETEYLAQIE